MSRIAVTGSSGLIGVALRARLESRGHEVMGVRRGDPSDPLSHWNPERGWFREGALEGFDAVVHLAGASIGEGRWTSRRKEELRTSRTDATRLLVDHLSSLQRRPTGLVSASAVGYYGDRGDEDLGEESGPGEGFLADLVQDWEEEASRARNAGASVALLRFGVVLAREGGALPRMLLPFRMGVGGRLGSGRQWMSWLTLPDAVGAIDHALNQKLDGAFNVAAPSPVTNREFTAALGKALRRPTVFPVPAIALRLAIGGSADELLLSSQRALPAKLVATGFTFRHGDIASAIPVVLAGGSQP